MPVHFSSRPFADFIQSPHFEFYFNVLKQADEQVKPCCCIMIARHHPSSKRSSTLLKTMIQLHSLWHLHEKKSCYISVHVCMVISNAQYGLPVGQFYSTDMILGSKSRLAPSSASTASKCRYVLPYLSLQHVGIKISLAFSRKKMLYSELLIEMHTDPDIIGRRTYELATNSESITHLVFCS